MFILSQIINGIGTILNIIAINQKKKQLTLILFTLGNTCVAIALGLLHAYAGMTIEIMFVIQSIINYFWEKKNPNYPIWLILIYIIIPCAFLLINFTSFWDILPLLAAIFFPLALISKDFVLRFLNFLSVSVWIPYNFHYKLYAGAISCIVFAILNLYAIYRYDYKQKKIENK